MPLTLICRRCNTNVQTDDRFCQECGFDLKTASAANASPVVPRSGNNFDFSPTENKQFEWPSLVEDPASGNSKAFSTPALDRKFSRYRDKEPNWEGSETSDQIDPHGEQYDVTEGAELSAYTSVETQIEQSGLEAQSIPQSPTEVPPIATSNGATAESMIATTDSASATVAGAGNAAGAAKPSTISNTTSEQLVTQSDTTETTGATTSDTTIQLVKRLHSPLLEKEAAQKKLQQPKGRPVFLMDAAAIIAVLAFAVALGAWGYNNYSKRELAGANRKGSAAQVSAKNNELLASYKSLFALSILSQKGLDTNQQTTFDDAAFRLGQEAFSAGKITEAQDYLKNVSAASANYSKAQELIKSAETGATGPSNGASSAANNQASKTSRREPGSNNQKIYLQTPNAQSPDKQLSERRVLSIPVLPELEAQSNSSAEEAAVTETSEEPAKAGNGLVIEMAGDASSNTEASQASNSTSSTGGVLSFSPENAIREGRPRRKRQAASSASTSSQVSTKNKAQEEPTPKFSESEISVYNRLLGKFIAEHGQKAAQSEPPSFKEWIRKGKPAF